MAFIADELLQSAPSTPNVSNPVWPLFVISWIWLLMILQHVRRRERAEPREDLVEEVSRKHTSHRNDDE